MTFPSMSKGNDSLLPPNQHVNIENANTCIGNTLGASHFTWVWLSKVPCCIAATIIRRHVFRPAITEARLKYLNTVSFGNQKDWDIKQTVEHTRITGNLIWQWYNGYSRVSGNNDPFKHNNILYNQQLCECEFCNLLMYRNIFDCSNYTLLVRYPILTRANVFVTIS